MLSERTTSRRNKYMRLVLEKVLRSDITKYLKKDELIKLNLAFISAAPGEAQHNLYFEADHVITGKNKGVIANISLSWILTKELHPDEEGNLFSIFQFSLSTTIRECYGLTAPTLDIWLDCLSSLNHLICEIRSMRIPDTVHELTHNNEERIIYEIQKRHSETCEKLAKYFQTKEGEIWKKNLRQNGSPKNIPLDVISNLLKEVSENSFNLKIKINASSWLSRSKNYRLEIEKNKNIARLYKVS